MNRVLRALVALAALLLPAVGRADPQFTLLVIAAPSNPFDIAIHRVLGVDEASYDPTRIWPGQVGQRMGKDYPEAWFHRYEKGRVFVTLLGHDAEMYRDDCYLQHLLGGITWAATGLGEQR